MKVTDMRDEKRAEGRETGREDAVSLAGLELENRELRAEVDDLEALLASSSTGALIVDSALRIRRFTPAIAAALGILPMDSGRHVGTLVDALDCPGLEDDVRMVLRGGTPVERTARDRSGRRLVLRCTMDSARPSRHSRAVVIMVSPDGEPGTAGSDEHARMSRPDLEKRVAALERRNELLHQLSRRRSRMELAERTRLARVLHDELQQTIAAAKIRLDLAESFMPDGSGREQLESAAQSLDEAVRASRSLASELNPPILGSSDLSKALSWLVRFLRDNYRLELTFVEEAVAPLSDDTKLLLFRAARELLVDAAEHARASSGVIELVDAEEGWVSLRVETDRTALGQEPGTGPSAEGPSSSFSFLREEVDGLGGRVECRSSSAEGMQVRILVPADGEEIERASGAPFASEPRTRAPLPRARSSRKKVRVLIVDDHRIVREGISAMLKSQEAIEVIGEARDGREALDLATRVEPDVVLMDVDLPDVSGIEVTRLIKSQAPHVEVIGLSMHAGEEVASSMRAAGAADFLTKGCRPDVLFGRIQAVVRNGHTS